MDASEIVIAGPRTDLLDQEATLIREYLNKGGKALVMLDPNRRALGIGLSPESEGS